MMPPSFARRWFNRRALLLHLLLVVEVPLCLLAGWWQATVAMSGNTLSYVYAVEWPGFACVGVYAWWHLLHMSPPPAGDLAAPNPPGGGCPGGREPAGAGVRPRAGTAPAAAPLEGLTWDAAVETPAWRAYNAYLAEMHASGRRRRWRPPARRRWAPALRRSLAPPGGGATGGGPA